MVDVTLVEKKNKEAAEKRAEKRKVLNVIDTTATLAAFTTAGTITNYLGNTALQPTEAAAPSQPDVQDQFTNVAPPVTTAAASERALAQNDAQHDQEEPAPAEKNTAEVDTSNNITTENTDNDDPAAFWADEGMEQYDASIFGKESLTDANLAENEAFLNAAKVVYDMKNGEGAWDKHAEKEANSFHLFGEFNANEKLADWAIGQMRGFNMNMVGMGVDVAHILNATPEQKQAFLYLSDAYDAKDTTAGGVFKSIGWMAADPTTYVGIASLGAGFVAAQGGKVAAKTAIRAAVKEAVKDAAKAGIQKEARREIAEQVVKKEVFKTTVKTARNNAVIGGVEGAAYGRLDEAGRQTLAYEAGRQEERWDLDKLNEATRIGAIFGGGLGGTLSFAGPAIGRAFKKGWENTKNVASEFKTATNNLVERARELQIAKQDSGLVYMHGGGPDSLQTAREIGYIFTGKGRDKAMPKPVDGATPKQQAAASPDNAAPSKAPETTAPEDVSTGAPAANDADVDVEAQSTTTTTATADETSARRGGSGGGGRGGSGGRGTYTPDSQDLELPEFNPKIVDRLKRNTMWGGFFDDVLTTKGMFFNPITPIKAFVKHRIVPLKAMRTDSRPITRPGIKYLDSHMEDKGIANGLLDLQDTILKRVDDRGAGAPPELGSSFEAANQSALERAKAAFLNVTTGDNTAVLKHIDGLQNKIDSFQDNYAQASSRGAKTETKGFIDSFRSDVQYFLDEAEKAAQGHPSVTEWINSERRKIDETLNKMAGDEGKTQDVIEIRQSLDALASKIGDIKGSENIIEKLNSESLRHAHTVLDGLEPSLDPARKNAILAHFEDVQKTYKDEALDLIKKGRSADDVFHDFSQKNKELLERSYVDLEIQDGARKDIQDFVESNRDKLQALRDSADALYKKVDTDYKAQEHGDKYAGLNEGQRAVYLEHIARQRDMYDDLLNKGVNGKYGGQMAGSVEAILKGKYTTQDVRDSLTGLSAAQNAAIDTKMRLTKKWHNPEWAEKDSDASEIALAEVRERLERTLDEGKTLTREHYDKPVHYKGAFRNKEYTWQNEIFEYYTRRDESGNLAVNWDIGQAKNNLITILMKLANDDLYFEHEALFSLDMIARMRQAPGHGDKAGILPAPNDILDEFRKADPERWANDAEYRRFAEKSADICESPPGRTDASWLAEKTQDSRQARHQGMFRSYLWHAKYRYRGADESDDYNALMPWFKGYLGNIHAGAETDFYTKMNEGMAKPARVYRDNKYLWIPLNKAKSFFLGAYDVRVPEANDFEIQQKSYGERDPIIQWSKDPEKATFGSLTTTEKLGVGVRAVSRIGSLGMLDNPFSLNPLNWVSKPGAAIAGASAWGMAWDGYTEDEFTWDEAKRGWLPYGVAYATTLPADFAINTVAIPTANAFGADMGTYPVREFLLDELRPSSASSSSDSEKEDEEVILAADGTPVVNSAGVLPGSSPAAGGDTSTKKKTTTETDTQTAAEATTSTIKNGAKTTWDQTKQAAGEMAGDAFDWGFGWMDIDSNNPNFRRGKTVLSGAWNAATDMWDGFSGKTKSMIGGGLLALLLTGAIKNRLGFLGKIPFMGLIIAGALFAFGGKLLNSTLFKNTAPSVGQGNKTHTPWNENKYMSWQQTDHEGNKTSYNFKDVKHSASRDMTGIQDKFVFTGQTREAKASVHANTDLMKLAGITTGTSGFLTEDIMASFDNEEIPKDVQDMATHAIRGIQVSSKSSPSLKPEEYHIV